MRELINKEAATLRALHNNVHLTVVDRDRSKSGLRRWAQAVKAFHAYEPAIDESVSRACSEDMTSDPLIWEFALCFLEENPMFFRSGFIKQCMLQRIHRAPLDKHQRARLRAVIVDGVKNRGTREFRHYCRCATHLCDAATFDAIECLVNDNDDAVASRARMMVAYLQRHEQWRQT